MRDRGVSGQQSMSLVWITTEVLAAAQGRRTKPKKTQANAEVRNDAAGFLGMVPPVPHGNGLAFPEFAAALKARLQADAAEGSVAHGRRRALATHDEEEAAYDADLGADDDGVQDRPVLCCLLSEDPSQRRLAHLLEPYQLSSRYRAPVDCSTWVC